MPRHGMFNSHEPHAIADSLGRNRETGTIRWREHALWDDDGLPPLHLARNCRRNLLQGAGTLQKLVRVIEQRQGEITCLAASSAGFFLRQNSQVDPRFRLRDAFRSRTGTGCLAAFCIPPSPEPAA